MIKDEEFAWLWCGTEADAKIIGPFLIEADAQTEARYSACVHDHVSFLATPRQIARSFPRDQLIKYWGGDILVYGSADQGGRTLVRRPMAYMFGQSSNTYALALEVHYRMCELHEEARCLTPSSA